MPHEIAAFHQQVRFIGGAKVPAICRSEELPFAVHGSDRVVIAYGCSCGEAAMADIPYTAENGRTRGCRVCAVCDAATLMPRIAA